MVYILTRRDFVKQASAGLVAVFAVRTISGLESIAKASPQVKGPTHKRITFEEARANISLRPQYIDQLAGEEFGEEAYRFADRFVYDHDKNLAIDYAISNLHGDIFDPKNTQHTLDELMAEVLSKRPEYKKEEKLLRSILEAELKRRLKQKVDEIYELEKIHIMRKIKYAAGATIDVPRSKQKSRIFLFKEIFNDDNLTSLGLGMYPSSEEKIRGILRHEYTHAKTFAKIRTQGIVLSKGLVLNESNYYDIHPEVRDFVTETIVYIQEADSAKRKLGANNPVYVRAVVGLAAHVYKSFIDDAIRPSDYSGINKQLVEHQMNSIKNAAKRHPMIKPLLERLIYR